MRKLISKLAVVMLAVLMACGVAGVSLTPVGEALATEGEGEEAPVASPEKDKKPETSILPGEWADDSGDGIMKLLKLILNIVVYGLGAAAVLGVIIAGIMYMTARDNEAQIAKAKTRLFEVVIGLIAWALMYTVLNWLIPGGLNVGALDNDPASQFEESDLDNYIA